MASASPSPKKSKNEISKLFVIDSQPRSLNDLPDEILLNILSYFGPEDLCLIIAKVCERWNNLAKDLSLWKTLSYKLDGPLDNEITAEVLRFAPALHSLIIPRSFKVENILKFLFHIRGKLRKLSIEKNLLGTEIRDILTNTAALHPDLESLSLTICLFYSPASYIHFSGLKKLCELNILCSKGFSGEGVRLIADSCQHLKKMNLSDVDLIDEDVIHVINKLGKQLTTLILNGRLLTDVGYSCLKNCTRLQELALCWCNHVTDSGLQEGIASLQELTSLRLTYGVNLSAQAFSKLLHQPFMSSIVLLDLKGCRNLDAEGLKGIALSCIHLKNLDISECSGVTDADIGMVIRHCSELRVLSLKGLRTITGEEWMVLVSSCLPHLRELHVVDCDNLRYEYVRELVAALPELAFYYYEDINNICAVSNIPALPTNFKFCRYPKSQHPSTRSPLVFSVDKFFNFLITNLM